MAKYSKKEIDADIAAASAIQKTGETGDNTGLALDNQEKQKMKLKEKMKAIAENIKEDPAGTIGAAAQSAREPLVEYQKAQRERQAVPTADELAPEPINLVEAFNI